jgi:hypothetical protein
MSDTQRFVMDEEETAFTFADALDEIEEKDFDESKHPRDTGGKFSESGGGGSDESQGLTGGAVDEFLDKYGLHSEDEKNISAWLGSGYRELRNDPSFAKTLEKLPKYSGRVYRGTRLAEKDLAKLKPGAVYNMEKFSSSSPRSTVAAEYMQDAQRYAGDKKVTVMMEINDAGRKLPRDMAGFYGSDAEEVVLMRGDKYKITAVEPTKDDEGNTFVRVKMSHVP